MVGNDDITWGEMWAEEEAHRRAAVDAALEASPAAAVEPYPYLTASPPVSAAPHEHNDPSPRLAAEPYFGGRLPHHPQPQPYFELDSTDPMSQKPDSFETPPPRVELPRRPEPKWFDEDPDNPAEKFDWQALTVPGEHVPGETPSNAKHAAKEDPPQETERSWNQTWADGIHLRHGDPKS